MRLYANERTALFIDGLNLHATAKSLGFDIDFKRMLQFFQSKTHLVRALYYTAIPREPEYASFRPLLDWLSYNGFTVISKPAKEFSDSSGRPRFKNNIDVELTVDAMRLAASLDHIIIFSGDGDLVSLVAGLKEFGKRVSIVCTLRTDPPIVADELRRCADHFIDLADLEKEISRSYSDVRARNGAQQARATDARGRTGAVDDDN